MGERFEAAREYAHLMEGIHATPELRARVLSRARQERTAASASQQARAAGSRRDAGRLRRRLGAAACAGLAAVLAATLIVPQPGLRGMAGLDAPFIVQAYGSDGEALLPSGDQNGRIVFDVEAETQRIVDPDAASYVDSGFYTGCVFGVQGEDVVRVQANISKGELYRMTSVQYTPRSDPELAQAVASWKPTSIGEEGPLQRYDAVRGAVYPEDADAVDENAGRVRGDPEMVCDVRLYQRLGQTIDIAQEAEPETPLSSYRFGLWTNIPFDALDPDQALAETPPDMQAYDRAGWYNLDAALDTLDGAVLTVTVTFSDGSCATQEIALHAADMEAQAVETADGRGHAYEVLPRVVADGPRASADDIVDGDEYIRLLADGSSVLHTLYGTLTATGDGAFPCGEATHPELERPLTKAQDAFAGETAAASGEPALPRIADADIWELGDAYKTALLGIPSEDAQAIVDEDGSQRLSGAFRIEDGASVTVTGARRLDALPAGVSLQDMVAWYDAGGLYDSALDHITDESEGFTIAADGSLTPGFSYVAVDIVAANQGDAAGEAMVCWGDGAFAILGDEVDSEGCRTFDLASPSGGAFLWRSGHDAPGWDAHVLFAELEPGVPRAFTLLYVLPDAALADEGLCLRFEGCPREGPPMMATGLVRLGALG